MTELDSFLQSLRDNPHDEELRLIFADWLDDRDDPRVEWMRDSEIARRVGANFDAPINWAPQEIEQFQNQTEVLAVLQRMGDPISPHLLSAICLEQFSNCHGIFATAIIRIGTSELGSLDELVELLDHPNEVVQELAIRGIGAFGTEARSVVPTLLQFIRENNARLGFNLSTAFENIGYEVLGDLNALIALLDDDSLGICELTIEALGKLGSEASLAVPRLLQLWDEIEWDSGDDPREGIIWTLGKIGHAAASAAPRLVTAILEDHHVSEAAACSLPRLGPQAANAIYEQRSEFDDEDTRRVAIETLMNLKSLGRSLVARILADPTDDRELRILAAQIVINYNATDKEIRSALREMKQSPDQDLRTAARQALRHIREID